MPDSVTPQAIGVNGDKAPSARQQRKGGAGAGIAY